MSRSASIRCSVIDCVNPLSNAQVAEMSIFGRILLQHIENHLNNTPVRVRKMFSMHKIGGWMQIFQVQTLFANKHSSQTGSHPFSSACGTKSS